MAKYSILVIWAFVLIVVHASCSVAAINLVGPQHKFHLTGAGGTKVGPLIPTATQTPDDDNELPVVCGGFQGCNNGVRCEEEGCECTNQFPRLAGLAEHFCIPSWSLVPSGLVNEYDPGESSAEAAGGDKQKHGATESDDAEDATADVDA